MRFQFLLFGWGVFLSLKINKNNQNSLKKKIDTDKCCCVYSVSIAVVFSQLYALKKLWKVGIVRLTGSLQAHTSLYNRNDLV